MIRSFRERFGAADGVRVFRAPGRVNLIGDHTDYNLGFVLPVALELATYVATAPGTGGKLRIYSEDRQEMREFIAADAGWLSRAGDWTDYPMGVARELAIAGFAIEPANLLIRSTVPEGAGLSSSAALEVSSALAFLNGRTGNGQSMGALDLARLCQRAERDFVGLPCGIMDQYISVFGQEHRAVEIDCRSLGHRLVPLPSGVTFVAVNSMVKHALSGSAYRDRVAECAVAVSVMHVESPRVESLRDVTPEQLAQAAHLMPETVARRARHVVTENARVNRFVDASSSGDPELMGRLMIDSHRSLQHDYQVSCAELDFLVDAALGMEGVLGSRMTGGGFGGCTVTLLRDDAAARFRSRIAQAYHLQFQVIPLIYSCTPSAGAGEVKNFEIIPARN
jgi:galactokinase